MRDRSIQRALRKLKITMEEPIDLHDYCGVRQDTPKEAVDHMIETRKKLIKELKNCRNCKNCRDAK